MKRMAAYLCAGYGLICLSGAPQAEAWGCHGHQTVAYLAEKHLTPQAKDMVDKLLSENPVDPALSKYCDATGLDAMADASTWADNEREVDRSTAPWHYIDISLGAKQGQAKDFCSPEGCVTRAIAEQLAILKDQNAAGAKRAAALRFVIHFVADLHEPLHGSTNGDRGGNCVPVNYFGRSPQETNTGYTPNLHQIWDTDILERRMQGSDPAEFADQLDETYSASFAGWENGGMQLDKWAWESHQQAVETVYGALPKKIATEPDVAVRTCAGNNNIGKRMLAKNIVIDLPYQTKAARVIEKRLAQAGIRLAMILNDAGKIAQ